MQINHEIFDLVDYTAVGLLSVAAAELGMEFTPAQLTELVMRNKIDDRADVMKSFDMLINKNLLLLKDNRYYINSDYVVS
jgi:hypothetical protein